MKRVFFGGSIVNVFTGVVERADVAVDGEKIIGVGDYSDYTADEYVDVTGKVLCPSFVDAHIHIESTMLSPAEFARVCAVHGTGAVVADPHEIANVCGRVGIAYMLVASENLPVTVHITLPSCVPASPFDESGAVLTAADLKQFYAHPRVIGLAEMMNYPGAVNDDPEVINKIADAKAANLTVNGHAPMLTGRELDKYISAGVGDDHECTSAEEAMERVRKGQRVLIRQGTAARNLKALMPLTKYPYCERCMLVTDDRHPADLLTEGHIDRIIRDAIKLGGDPVTLIRMATLLPCEYYGLKNRGAIAPGYYADFIISDDIESLSIPEVWKNGAPVVKNGKALPFDAPGIEEDFNKYVLNSFFMDPVTAADFMIAPKGSRCRVMRALPGQLLTEAFEAPLIFDEAANGIDTDRDILKIAVIERHMNTGHIGLGFVQGFGLKSGAIASSVSHDSHNLIVIGANENDMAVAANRVRSMRGGMAVVNHGEVTADLPLPIAGLMNPAPAEEVVRLNKKLREKAAELGGAPGVEPFMNMSFVALPVIPSLKLTTRGLVDVNSWKRVELFT